MAVKDGVDVRFETPWRSKGGGALFHTCLCVCVCVCVCMF